MSNSSILCADDGEGRGRFNCDGSDALSLCLRSNRQKIRLLRMQLVRYGFTQAGVHKYPPPVQGGVES